MAQFISQVIGNAGSFIYEIGRNISSYLGLYSSVGRFIYLMVFIGIINGFFGVLFNKMKGVKL